MKFLIFLTLNIFLVCISFGQQEKFSKIRIYFDDRSPADLLQLGVTCDHGNHKPSIFFESDFSQSDIRLLDLHGFRFDVLIDDVVTYYQDQNTEVELRSNSCNPAGPASEFSQPANFALGSMGGYLTYQQMLDNLDSMYSKYPNLITSRTVIDSNTLTHDNHPIYWLKISDNPNIDEAEPEALYNALHHAREPLSLSQLIYFMWYLLENYSTSAEIQYLIDNTELYFIPCVNPDGYIYNETTNPNGGGMWRKNRRNNGGSFGVDLNRNYGFAYAYDNIGSSGQMTSDTYRGPSAFSEPETQNVRDFCIAHNFIFSLNYHTYGAQLIYPWAYNDQLTADSNAYRAYAPLMTKDNNYEYGTNMETIGYSTNGDADDWIYGEQTTKNKILSLTPEAGTGGFWPPSSSIVDQCQGTMWQNLAIPHFMLIYGHINENSSPLITTTTTTAYFDLTRYGMMAGPLTVSIIPVSSNIQSVGPSKQYNLSQFTTVSDSFDIVLNATVLNGDTVRYIMMLDNGYFTKIDTIERVYGNYIIAFNDDANTMNYWVNQGSGSNWEVTTSTFYSATGSLTDSRIGNYSNNSTSEIVLNQTLDLSAATDASIQFMAKWNIETDYDYVQIMAAGNSGIYEPLCGLYTEDGTNYQDLNKPLYHGFQNNWVAERMSLIDFLGESSVTIKIRLVSDTWVNEDGFYFDDFKVNVLTHILGNTMDSNHDKIDIGQNQPNPGILKIHIPIDVPGDFNTSLDFRIFNVFGQQVYFAPFDSKATGITIEVEKWEEGVYFYQLVGKNFRSEPMKMLITK
ncbi:M14 family zinc carboxypeptidase [Aureispira]|nr:M14 family zinc carboxypeptidase [Aureispira sp.]